MNTTKITVEFADLGKNPSQQLYFYIYYNEKAELYGDSAWTLHTAAGI